MGRQTGAAVLGAVGQPAEVSAAAAAQRIQRTVTEQAVEVLRPFRLVAGEELTVFVLEKRVIAVLRLHAQAVLFFRYHTRYPISFA